jgi:elongation factor P
MLTISDLKLGTVFVYDGDPFQVVKLNHSKQARQGAVLQTKIKNLKTGAALERNFKSSDKFDEADIGRSKASFLYANVEKYEFMEDESYEQFSLTKKDLGDNTKYLKESCRVELVKFEDQVIGIQLPPKVDLEVVEAPPGVKGDTASGATKNIVLETGLNIQAPLFVDQGDTVKVNTETGEYVERVKE